MAIYRYFCHSDLTLAREKWRSATGLQTNCSNSVRDGVPVHACYVAITPGGRAGEHPPTEPCIGTNTRHGVAVQLLEGDYAYTPGLRALLPIAR